MTNPLVFPNAIATVNYGDLPPGTICEGGITLRDFFAAAALIAFSGGDYNAQYASREAFEYADAMLVERQNLEDKKDV